jgi:glutamate-1-semialdehyde 2,1-aminomutase
MTYPDPSSKSAQLFERARKVLPDGGSRSSISMAPYTPYIAKAQGKLLTDVDGNEYIDFNNNFTSLIHGHAHPAIVEAVTAQIGVGSAVSFFSEAELKLAELICARCEAFDKIRFMNSGTEAVMNAIKAARAFTGKFKIAKCENFYHGSFDASEVSLGVEPTDLAVGDPVSQAYSHGTPPGVMNDVVVIPFADVEIAERILNDHADELACVLFDPFGPGLGRYPPEDAFLQMLARFRQQTGVLLVFDEVVAFRAGYSGAQAARGLPADITALGKIIGGGYPVGAVAGPADIMSVFEAGAEKARLPHGGTFNANPVTMAAGYAAMTRMTESEFDRLNTLGDEFRAGLREVLDLTNTGGRVLGQASIFAIEIDDEVLNGQSNRRGYTFQSLGLHNYMMNKGYFLSPGMYGALSTLMDRSDIDPLCQTLLEGIRALR